jgi:hypothetical protein
MSGGETTGNAAPLTPEELIAIISSALVAEFGERACDVVERQIEQADGETLARWNAIWAYLCGPEARRA